MEPDECGDDDADMNDDILAGADDSFYSLPTSCAYLPGRRARFEYRLVGTLSAAQYEQLLERGWRRFGRLLFRPACRTCHECLGLRVCLQKFTPSRSQRRCLRRNADIRIRIQPPSVSPRHVQLYNGYHQDMHARRGWPLQQITESEYVRTFVEGGFEFAREFLYFRQDRLVGIGLVDMTDRVQSSVYFVCDPSWRSRSPGTFSVLSEIETGRAAGRDSLYLGYYIRECGSMNYKNRFRPYELLHAFVPDGQVPQWNLPDDPESSVG